jgi:hypothetical protein
MGIFKKILIFFNDIKIHKISFVATSDGPTRPSSG